MRPDIARLTRLAQECNHALTDVAESEARLWDTSRLQPPQPNTSFGAFGDYPQYSALTGVAPKEYEGIIALLLAAALGPRILMRIEGLAAEADPQPAQAKRVPARQISADNKTLMGALRRTPPAQLAHALQEWSRGHASKDLEYLPLPEGTETPRL